MGMIACLKLVGGAGLATLLLAGCTRGVTSTPNLQSWVAEERARPARALEPLPVMQQFETFEYAAQGLRDPFADAWVSPNAGNGLRPDPARRKQPLEAFPLDTLTMVGTIGVGSAMVALVMAPDKVTYRVRPGVYLGQSDGRVTAIDEAHVDLIELVPDGAGSWLERPASITLDQQ